MARGVKKEKAKAALTPEEKLATALVPVEEQPYRVPGNWCWTTLSNVAEVITGSTPSKKHPEYYGDMFPFFKPSDLDAGRYVYNASEYLSEEGKKVSRIIPAHSSAVCCIGSIGKSGFLMCEGTTNQQINSAVPRITPLYLYYYFQTDNFVNELWNKASATTISIVNKSKMEQCTFPLAPLFEQQRIVDRIESLFAKLDEAKEKAQAVVDGFEDRKAAILHKAFTGELIGLSGSSTTPLETIVDTIRIGPFGSALHKEDYVSDGIPVVNPKHISNQIIMPENNVTITEAKANELSNYRLMTGDIIMGRRGEMGRSAPVTEKESGWLCGTGSLIIRLQKGYDASFYSQILASQSSVQFLEENCVGSTMKNLNDKVIRRLPVPRYTKDKQQRIIDILSTILSREQQAKEGAERTLAQINTMKKAILARAFRGELGTNNPSDISAETLLRELLEEAKA